MVALSIAIVGDFDRGKNSHWATEAALFHAAAQLRVEVRPEWVPTRALADDAGPLTRSQGVWGAPGSPFESSQGMLRAITHARESDLPYLGTCAGFQFALIEFTRNVLGIRDADSAENNPDGNNVVITPVACPVPPPAGEPALSGEGVVRVGPGTLLERLCGRGELSGEYCCSLEANAAFLPRWQHAGLRVAGRGSDGELRAFELPDKRFFLATLFRPQLLSSYARPHPIVLGFLEACAGRSVG